MWSNEKEIRVDYGKPPRIVIYLFLGMMAFFCVIWIADSAAKGLTHGDVALLGMATLLWAFNGWLMSRIRYMSTSALRESGLYVAGVIGAKRLSWKDIERWETRFWTPIRPPRVKKELLRVWTRGANKPVDVGIHNLMNTPLLKRAVELAAKGRPDASVELVREHGVPRRPLARYAASFIIPGLAVLALLPGFYEDELDKRSRSAFFHANMSIRTYPDAAGEAMEALAQDPRARKEERCLALERLILSPLGSHDRERASRACHLINDTSCSAAAVRAQDACASLGVSTRQ